MLMQDPTQFDEKFIDEWEHELLYMHDPDTTVAERIWAILDAKYCPTDLQTITHKTVIS